MQDCTTRVDGVMPNVHMLKMWTFERKTRKKTNGTAHALSKTLRVQQPGVGNCRFQLPPWPPRSQEHQLQHYIDPITTGRTTGSCR